MKKKVLIVVDNLAMGGVTKVLSNFLNFIDYNKYDIDLLILHYVKDMQVNFPKQVNIVKGTKFFSIVDVNISKIVKDKNIIKLIHKVIFGIMIKTNVIKLIIKNNRKKILKKEYDSEIAFNDGFCYIYTAYGKSENKIAWMHSDVEVKDYSARYYKTIKKALSMMNIAIGVSEKVCKSYKEKYDIKKYRIIPNIIDEKQILEKSNEENIDIYNNEFLNFINVGRLDYSKNHEMLLRIHKRLKDEGYKIKTYIIGDGQEREKINNMIIKENLQESFILLGRKDNPYPYVKKADCFILSSRYEGLPTVIIEALILHIPCISTRVAGIDELLKSEYGIVTENDEQALYEGIKNVVTNRESITKYKENLKDYKYNNEEILKSIYEIL